MIVVLIVSVVVAFLLGGMVGSAGTTAVKVQFYQHVQAMIGMIEEVKKHTNDQRIPAQVILDPLYHLRQTIRIPDRLLTHQDFTDRPDQ